MENKIALLIDCDNISFKVIDAILKELEQYGEVIIKRAYGNWRSDNLKNWIEKLTELSIKPIYQIDYTKGKNASDMAIVIDAMDLLHLKKVNSFGIVSSDSDFTPLAMKIMEEDFKVYCFGNNTTPCSLKNSCSVFTDIQSLVHDKDEVKPEKFNKNKLKEKIFTIFNEISPTNEYISLENINEYFKEHNIDYKTYGFKQLKFFIDDLNLFQIHINDKKQGFIKLKKIPKNNKVVLNKDESVFITDLENFESHKKSNINKNIPKENKIYRLNKEEIFSDPKLKKTLIETYYKLAEKQKDVHLSTYFNNLSLKHQFNHKYYGYNFFKDFISEIDLFSLEQKDEQTYINLKN